MKLLLIITLYLTFISCNQNSYIKQETNLKSIDIPDSTGNWYSSLFDYRNYLTKITLAKKLNLSTLEADSLNQVTRIWVLGSMWNPKTVYSIKRKLNTWTISKIDYFLGYEDSIKNITDSIYNILITEKDILDADYDFLNLERLWELQTQSKMKNGSNYGCTDGYSLLIELNSPSHYKFLAYRCPDMHSLKDSTFYFSYDLLKNVQNITATSQ